MKAVILAGGKGTRLRPFTYSVPKPLLPVNHKPILEHILLHLKRHGVDEVYITIGHLGYQIKNYFGDGSELGIKIHYLEEDEPKGTAGCLLPLKDKLRETFLVVGGDNLTTLDFQDFIKFHKDKGGIASIVLTKMEMPIEYGIAETNEHVIKGFREKPTFRFDVSTMIYCFEPEIFKFIGEKEDFAKDVLPRVLKAGEKLHGYKFDGFWTDVGRHEDLRKVNKHQK